MFSPRKGKPLTKAALHMAKHPKSKAYSAIEIAEMRKNYKYEYYEDSKYCNVNGLNITAFRVANGRRDPPGWPKCDQPDWKDYFKMVNRKKREVFTEEAKKLLFDQLHPSQLPLHQLRLHQLPLYQLIARSAPLPIQKTP